MARPKAKLRIPRRRRRRPRILVCTPEITELPEGMGNAANWIRAKGGGLGDISAGLIRYLHEDDRFDLHVVLPKYDRQIVGLGGVGDRELDAIGPTLQRRGVHLVRDSAFSTSPGVYSETTAHPRVQRAVAFQRYIINQLLDDIRPDVVHCNDWMTGIVPAAARVRGIRSLFTIHNVFTEHSTPHDLDRGGIDVRRYLTSLYFAAFPGGNFEDTWHRNRIDFAASAIHSADLVNTVSPAFLDELVSGVHDAFVPESLIHALREKHAQGGALGILNAPNDTVDPRRARWAARFGPEEAMAKKAVNKAAFQERMGLAIDPDAPLFLWPNRLYEQKGVTLLLDVLQRSLAKHMQVAIVANGDAKTEERLGVLSLGSQGRIARQPFSEELSEIGKAGADFLLMPSRYEPCGLPQMEGPRFGALPVVRATGGLKDTVFPLDVEARTGNGFVFEHYEADGFAWALEQALAFHAKPFAVREETVRRVMREAFARHTLERTASQYVDVYESLIAKARR
ncbi:MAG TPA: glycogen/starch synthase [Polyangiaceae bacterium LLY-WYZ-15_(1-7)]|nr:glycogen/starch synthase [Polyangiaceae bacterium LLY-WYZ-15_(1-7)]HJL02170.1 glycogen/starch synthase [Polyangiaceae bacterium LLY-WYZ-15_(1-7)]HJL13250.1 glycogen/starch synthase [Polyangiaceae bacterium LLY-WYZ-15_(1-7)]HJL26236.1 glycogen/starch synthase [Polyangiaceae bacterium LLY-WYZ-15_(1-7)]HJL32896.1 glycogen/starch synthase [Polyangiaceae bacterium LLY-WYZ-15_(1-7)]